jgi:hypothetical protein
MIQHFAFLVGQTPRSARVPLDPPVADRFSAIQTSKPTRALREDASAAGTAPSSQRARPTEERVKCR